MAQVEVVAFFKNEPRLDKGASEKEGRPIYVDREVCVIRIPGDGNRVVVQPADHGKWETDPITKARRLVTFKERFSRQYEQFKAGEAQSQAGTPLNELPFLTEAKRRELRAVGVLTAENLAALEGNQLKSLGQGGRKLKDQAEAFLLNAQGLVDTLGMTNQIAEQAKQIEALSAKIAALQAGKPAEETAPAKASPFDDYEADDIRAWLKDAAPNREIDGRWGKAKLIEVADEVNAELQGNKGLN